MSDGSISGISHLTDNENIDQADDWGPDCLEYLFNKKIWLPDLVRSASIRSIIDS